MLAIVIPAKDEERNLPRLLESIRSQTRPPAEIVVADAGSTDRTREIAGAFGARVVDGGLPGVGRNRGAEVVSSELVLFLDADVVLDDPEFLSRVVAEFLERRLDIATCDVFPLSSAWVDHAMHRAYNTYVRVLGRRFPHAPGFCLLVRRSLHRAIGGFDETVLFCEDHDYANRAVRVGHGRFGILRSAKIPVSVRRLDRDGRMNVALKYALAEIHLVVAGPIRHDRFKYGFGYGGKGDKTKGDEIVE